MSDRREEVVVPVDWGDEEDPATEEAPAKILSGNAALPLSRVDEVVDSVPTKADDPPGPPPVASVASKPPARREPVQVALVPASPPPAREPSQLVRGQRTRLADLGFTSSLEISVRLGVPSGNVVDIVCLGLDAHSRLSDERYFVFYNQKRTPCGGILLLDPAPNATGGFRLSLDLLPQSIDRVVVAAAFDGPGEMRALGSSATRWQDARGTGAEFAFAGSDFAEEKALMIVELYRKDGAWRTAALGQGFAGGLAALLGHFGAQAS